MDNHTTERCGYKAKESSQSTIGMRIRQHLKGAAETERIKVTLSTKQPTRTATTNWTWSEVGRLYSVSIVRGIFSKDCPSKPPAQWMCQWFGVGDHDDTGCPQHKVQFVSADDEEWSDATCANIRVYERPLLLKRETAATFWLITATKRRWTTAKWRLSITNNRHPGMLSALRIQQELETQKWI